MNWCRPNREKNACPRAIRAAIGPRRQHARGAEELGDRRHEVLGRQAEVGDELGHQRRRLPVVRRPRRTPPRHGRPARRRPSASGRARHRSSDLPLEFPTQSASPTPVRVLRPVSPTRRAPSLASLPAAGARVGTGTGRGAAAAPRAVRRSSRRSPAPHRPAPARRRGRPWSTCRDAIRCAKYGTA